MWDGMSLNVLEFNNSGADVEVFYQDKDLERKDFIEKTLVGKYFLSITDKEWHFVNETYVTDGKERESVLSGEIKDQSPLPHIILSECLEYAAQAAMFDINGEM